MGETNFSLISPFHLRFFFSVYLFWSNRHFSYQLQHWLLINHHLRTLQRLLRQDKGSSKMKQENKPVLFPAAPRTSQLFTGNCSAYWEVRSVSNAGRKEKCYSASIHPNKDCDVFCMRGSWCWTINASLRINLCLTVGRIRVLDRACLYYRKSCVLP